MKSSTLIQRLKPVLLDVTPAGLLIGCFAIAILLGFVSSSKLDSQIRVFGMCLQVFGLLVVAKGLSDRRRKFGHPSIFQRIRDCLKGIVDILYKKPPKRISVSVCDNLEMSDCIGRIQVTSAPQTLDEKIALLENRLNELKSEMDSGFTSFEQRVNDVGESIKQEQRERQKKHSELLDIMATIWIGGLALEGIGFIWLLCGVIATSIPGEIAEALSSVTK
jgi:hypothetical protein